MSSKYPGRFFENLTFVHPDYLFEVAMALNPVAAGKYLLKKYRDRLSFALEENNLPREVIHQILARMQIDSGIYLSLNPRYDQTNEPFANFVHQHDLPEILVSLLPKLSEGGLFTHQKQGILSILENRHTIVSTGTGSGKTETFLIPIISHCLRTSEPGVKAIIIYPMNALAGDQVERIGNYTHGTDITFGLYTGPTPDNPSAEKLERKFPNQLIYRDEIRANPPDILITNYVMLDRMLTREKDHRIFTESSRSMRYLVLDELHTYTGSKAAHLKCLLARLKYYFMNDIVYIGTSATLVSGKTGKERLDQFVTRLFEIGTYTFIEAAIAHEQQERITPVLPLTDADLEYIDFSSEERAAESLHRLTGERVDQFEFFTPPDDFHNTNVYQSLKNNSIVVAIHNALQDGAQSFDDLTRHISQVIPPQQFSALTPDKLLDAYLRAITTLTKKPGNAENRSWTIAPMFSPRILPVILKPVPYVMLIFLAIYLIVLMMDTCFLPSIVMIFAVLLASSAARISAQWLNLSLPITKMYTMRSLAKHLISQQLNLLCAAIYRARGILRPIPPVLFTWRILRLRTTRSLRVI